MATTVSTRANSKTETKVFKRMSPEEWRAYKRQQNANFLARKENQLSEREKAIKEQHRKQREAVKAAEDSGKWVQIVAPPEPKRKVTIDLKESKPTQKTPAKANLFANLNDDSDDEEEQEQSAAKTPVEEEEEIMGKMARINWADDSDDD